MGIAFAHGMVGHEPVRREVARPIEIAPIEIERGFP